MHPYSICGSPVDTAAIIATSSSSSYEASSTAPSPIYTSASSMSPPAPMLRPTSHSFSLQRPLLAQDVRKTRNSKRLSLLVPPSPGKLESLAAAAAAASSPSLQPPSTPSASSSFSTRRHFTSAPLSTTLPTVPQSTTTTPTVDTTAERQSFLMLDQALPTSRLPMMGGSTASSSSSNSRRPISAYFSDFSVECGVASPYTSEPVCILPHLYLGAEHNALDVNTLSRMGITSVLNVAVEIATAASQEQRQQLQLQQQQATHSGRGLTATTTATTMGGSKFVYTPQGRIIHYKNLSWTHHQKNLQEEFPVAFKFIEETKGLGGKVLVHCQLGVSRSASLVIAYVMKTQQMGLSDAYEFVKTRSAVISPNMSLMYQLAEFEKSLSRVGHALSTSPEDEDDDIYPYPTDGMDIGREYEEGRVREKKRINSSNSDRLSDQTMTLTPAAAGGDYPPKRVAGSASVSKRATLVLSSRPSPDSTMYSGQMPLATTRPRSPHYGSSSFSQTTTMDPVPRTPMTDRFSFSGLGPLTPPTPIQPRHGFHPLHPVQQLPQEQEQEHLQQQNMPIGSMEASYGPGNSTPTTLQPPLPLFFPTSSFHRLPPSSSSSSTSSLRTSIPSRPSSTSSASSASISISNCDIGSFTKEESKDSVTTESTASFMHSQTNNTSTKKAIIHSLATALTRRFSGRLHGHKHHHQNHPNHQDEERQQQQQQQQSPEEPCPVECLCSSADLNLKQGPEQVHTEDMVVDCEEGDEPRPVDQDARKETPEFVFSPRPCSPPLLETRTLGEFYQALRMEG